MYLTIFDCDGVLVDSEIVSFEVEAEALAELGAAVTARDLLRRFVGTSSSAMFATVARENGILLPPGFAERTTARCLAAFDARLRPVAGIAELLAGLAGPRCVASSSDPPRIRRCLALAGILHHFEPHIFSATQVRHGKPAPDLFLFAAERMGVRPERCVVIEDRAAGMAVFGLTAGSHCVDGHAAKLRAAGAREVFGSCRDLARALGR